MSNNAVNPCKVITTKCCLSYAHIWEPSSMNENSPAKYSACIIWPKTDKAMTEKILAATGRRSRRVSSPRGGASGPRRAS